MEDMLRDPNMRLELAVVQLDPSDGSQAGAETRGTERRLLQRRAASRECLLGIHESDSYIDSSQILLKATPSPSCRAREADSSAMMLGGDFDQPALSLRFHKRAGPVRYYYLPSDPRSYEWGARG
jgi:hypothetical protein